MPSPTDEDSFKPSPIKDTPPPPVGCIVNCPRIVTREHSNGNNELTGDQHSNQSTQGRRKALRSNDANTGALIIPRNLALDFPYQPLPASYHIKLVRVPENWLPPCQYMDRTDSAPFTNGVFTHEPAMVYNDLDQLISDLNPTELKKWRRTIMDKKESTTSYGMVARFFSTQEETDDLILLPVEGRSLEEDGDQFIEFFCGEEALRAEHLTEITIDAYKDSPCHSDQYQIYQHALEYKIRLQEAYDRIHLELYDELFPPDLLCAGIARTTGVDMPVLGSMGELTPCEVVKGVSPLDTSPKGVRQKHSGASLDGIETQLSKAKMYRSNKEKREYKIMALRSSMKMAESLIEKHKLDITPGTHGYKMFHQGVAIHYGVCREADECGLQNLVRSKFKKKTIKGLIRARVNNRQDN